MLPGLYCRLKEIGVEIPPGTGDFLAAVEEMNRERNERILDEAVEIAGMLNGIGIEPVAAERRSLILSRKSIRAGAAAIFATSIC